MSTFKSEIRKGVFWNLLLAFGRHGLIFLGTIILARMLTPEDYGLIGMMAIFISVSEALMDAGMGGALVKKRETTETDYSTLMCYNMVVSLIMYCLLFISAPFISSFYEKPILTSLLRIYSFVFIFEAIGIIPKVKLFRNLAFQVYAIANLIANFIGLVVAVFMANADLGVYSLVFQPIVSSATLSFIVIIQTKHRFKLGFSKSSFRSMFGFGINTTFSNMIKSAIENAYINVVAKISPLQQTGYFNQSFKMQNLITAIQNMVVDNALFPIFCRESNTQIVVHATKLNNYVMLLCTWGYLLLIQNSILIVRLILGEQWMGMIPIFKLVLIASIFQTFTAFNRNIFKSLDKTCNILRIEICSLPAFLGIFLFLKKDIMAVVCCYMFYAIFRWGVSVYWLHHEKIIMFKETIYNFIKVFVVPFLVFSMNQLFSLVSTTIIDDILKSLFFILFVVIIYEIFKVNIYIEIKKIIKSELKGLFLK
jgi:O-antigen/teichoic acid export membrane protein